MSKIYEYLKEKAYDHNYQDKLFYSVNNMFEYANVQNNYTFKDALNLTNECIEIFKKRTLSNISGKSYIVLASSCLEDIITMIALMELGAKPILVQKDSIYVYSKNLEQYKKRDFPYDISLPIKIDEMKDIEILKDYIIVDTKINHERIPYYIRNEEIKTILANHININNFDDEEYDFAVLTSGTTGEKKIFKMKEDILINKIVQNYELNESELYICPNPISSISGLIFSMYLPIIGKNKSILVSFKSSLSLDSFQYDYYNFITATNYFSNIYSYNKYEFITTDLDDFLKINKITLLGSQFDFNGYEIMRSAFSNVKEENIINLYGRTENYGLISKIKLSEMEPVYLFNLNLHDDKIIYSFDKVNVFEDVYINNKRITRKSNIRFNENDFSKVPSIATINTLNDNIKINNPIFGEILINGENTGDYGFILNNRVYLLCRQIDLWKLYNSWIYLPWVEKMINDDLKKIYPMEDVQAYCLEDEGLLNIYIPCNNDLLKRDNYITARTALEPLFAKLCYDEYCENIVLFDNDKVNQGDEISKFRKYKLKELNEEFPIMLIDNEDMINSILLDKVHRLLERKTILRYNKNEGYYIFSKSEYTPLDMAKIINSFRILECRETKNNYYMIISDEFLFSHYDDDSDTFKIPEAVLAQDIEKGNIRTCILAKYDLADSRAFRIGMFYNKFDRPCAVILGQARSSSVLDRSFKATKHAKYYLDKCEVEIRQEAYYNKYNYEKYNYYGIKEFSIDEDGVLYCDNELVHRGRDYPDIYDIMHNILIKNKQLLEGEGKHYAKH